MNGFVVFAEPWWVNLLVFVPFIAFAVFRRKRHALTRRELIALFIFGSAFGFVEASVVVYLRAALGMSTTGAFAPAQIVSGLPPSLFAMEFFREAATIAMLASVAYLTARGLRARGAAFLWAFAAWDIFYYIFLRFATGWPAALTAPDVLFLIPVPWYAQVWFPMLVSALTMVAVVTRL